MSSHHYWFDRWAEYLTVTLAENCARCELGLNKIEKIRIGLTEQDLWPSSFKVILNNDLIASLSNKRAANIDGSYPVQYMYQCPSSMPNSTHVHDLIADDFIKKARLINPEFYSSAWAFNNKQSLAYLLGCLSLRSVSRLIHKQLTHQGIELSENFNLQYFDGTNYQSFTYSELSQDIARQISLYFNDKRILKLLAELCFEHPENRKWLESFI